MLETYSINLTGTVTSISCDPNNWIINKTVGPTRDATLGIAPPTPTVDYTGLTEDELFNEIKQNISDLMKKTENNINWMEKMSSFSEVMEKMKNLFDEMS